MSPNKVEGLNHPLIKQCTTCGKEFFTEVILMESRPHKGCHQRTDCKRHRGVKARQTKYFKDGALCL